MLPIRVPLQKPVIKYPSYCLPHSSSKAKPNIKRETKFSFLAMRRHFPLHYIVVLYGYIILVSLIYLSNSLRIKIKYLVAFTVTDI